MRAAPVDLAPVDEKAAFAVAVAAARNTASLDEPALELEEIVLHDEPRVRLVKSR
jgi:hypothetical protein